MLDPPAAKLSYYPNYAATALDRQLDRRLTSWQRQPILLIGLKAAGGCHGCWLGVSKIGALSLLLALLQCFRIFDRHAQLGSQGPAADIH